MNIVIKNVECTLRDTEVENVDCTYDVDHLSLIIQLLEMLDRYKAHNNGAMPKSVTDLVEWKPKEEEKWTYD